MSNTALRAATTGQVAAPKTREDKVGDLIVAMKPQMAMALPKHLNPDRMARIVLTEIRRVPKLAECGRDSLLGAVMTCSQLGLEPGNGLGHAYLLPFDKRAKVNGSWQTVGIDCQLIIGYRGMIDLARRSGQIVSLSARAVFTNDRFNYRFGLDESIEHIPADGERGNLTHVYAVAKLKDGGVQFEVMSRAEIEKVRAASKAKDNGPWVTHFEEMAKKTAIRRLFKYLPVSIEMQRAVTIDEQGEAGIRQDHNVIDMETGEYGAPAGELPAPAGDQLSYAQLADMVTKATTVPEAEAVLAQATHLPEDQMNDLRKLAAELPF
ncbi:recombination protein RecT [Xenophilus sp. Marseille-Q4582]|uniref:recombination protein RecT n=1 Tax=Xenophilus sp. Marseille-Q4582 TaxID=2866600 RepID=UPI001CE4A0C8|nr:recombination protein RecT [Xenophilus sp. Marseille-Q4582]